MKVSIGINVQAGPWGGGNQAMGVLANYLERRGVEVSFTLTDAYLDLIILTEPRTFLKSSAYSERDILTYLQRSNNRALVVHRVNECDERKNTTGVNQRLRNANVCADHTVFVSHWLKDLHLSQGFNTMSCSVILNGSDRTIFNPEGYQRWDRKQPLRLVTHHWAGHWMKGFDVYERLDELLQHDLLKRIVSFTYIGNVPKGFRFKNATYLEPTSSQHLALLLKQHHVYLTASRNEPGANHQNEGANCGLPLLYRESGCLPEYCRGFGIAFKKDNFEEKLHEMVNTYDHWADRMREYPHTAERMCDNYYNLFVMLLDQRENLLKRRTQVVVQAAVGVKEYGE